MPKQNFSLDSHFYHEKRVLMAIEAFEGYTLSFKEGILTIDDENPRQVFDEFANYVTLLSNENIV